MSAPNSAPETSAPLSLDKPAKHDFLIRFVQAHEAFRLAEVQALAELLGADMEVVSYEANVSAAYEGLSSPFAHVRFPSVSAARSTISRSVLAQSVHELWGAGATSSQLRDTVRARVSSSFNNGGDVNGGLVERLGNRSFKFVVDAFRHSHSAKEQLKMINSFAFLKLAGPVRLVDPDETFTIFEDWRPLDTPGDDKHKPHGSNGSDDCGGENDDGSSGGPKMHLQQMYLGRLVSSSARGHLLEWDLKKRHYISTTSMTAELAAVTANLAQAGPGRLFYDPFVGTGSLPLAAAHFGAHCLGSDIDGRAVRGTAAFSGGYVLRPGEGSRSVRGNFAQYGLLDRFVDVFVADLVNSPVRRCGGVRQNQQNPSELGKSGQPNKTSGVDNGHTNIGRWLDGIICDPPYGVREGLRVLGARTAKSKTTPHIGPDGMEMFKDPSYIPPKRPYPIHLLFYDILTFAYETLVDHGRLAFWMPTANDDEVDEDDEDDFDKVDDKLGNMTLPTPRHAVLSCVSSTLVAQSQADLIGSIDAVDSNKKDKKDHSSSGNGIIPPPLHPGLTLVVACVQPFNRWSRRLVIYKRRPDACVDPQELRRYNEAVLRLREEYEQGMRATERLVGSEENTTGRGPQGETVERTARSDALNPFRKAYFTGFGKE